jgi:hypothetical protein
MKKLLLLQKSIESNLRPDLVWRKIKPWDLWLCQLKEWFCAAWGGVSVISFDVQDLFETLQTQQVLRLKYSLAKRASING